MGLTLITGGAGYIGSALVPQLLAAGRKVRVVDWLRMQGESLLPVWNQPGFEFQKGDITRAPDRERALDGVTSIIHLAAIVGDPACKKEPELARSVNLDATCALIDGARRHGVRDFIFVSTCSNYGISDPGQLATEQSPLNPVSLYAETKVEAERYLLQYAGPSFIPTGLRLATVYGVAPRMRFDLTVNEFARDAALGRKLVVFAEKLWRPYVHVKDVAAAIQLVLESPEAARSGQVFNVGHTTENYQKQRLCELLQARVPDLVVEYVAQGNDPRSYRVSFERIGTELGFRPQFRVPDGIDETLALVRDGIIADPDERRWRNS